MAYVNSHYKHKNERMHQKSSSFLVFGNKSINVGVWSLSVLRYLKCSVLSSIKKQGMWWQGGIILSHGPTQDPG